MKNKRSSSPISRQSLRGGEEDSEETKVPRTTRENKRIKPSVQEDKVTHLYNELQSL